MSPEELATRHPQLYHVTTPGSWPSIAELGLLSTRRMLELFEIEDEQRAQIERHRRPNEVTLEHQDHGKAMLNDQRPLSESKLLQCLDDGLSPAGWIAMLNDRVFFWADESRLAGLLNARMNRERPRDILVIDTLSLAKSYAEQIEICPINSGATIHRPARRGLKTFTRLGAMTFDEWRRQRGQRDNIVEVVIRDGVPDIARHVTEVRSSRGN